MCADNSLSERERLKSKTVINALFTESESLFAHPVKLFYRLETINRKNKSQVQFSVSVPKRLHKKASTRNKLKRLIREAYRHNKIPETIIAKGYYLALMYVLIDKEVSSFETIEKALLKLNKRLSTVLKSMNVHG